MQFSCEYNDDDWTYMDHAYCSGDAKVCDEYSDLLTTDDEWKGSRGAYEAMSQCGKACDGNMTWFVPCMWDTIANMDSYCGDGYNVSDDFMSKGSRNQGPNRTYFSLNMSKSTNVHTVFTGCNLHAFCYSCVEDDGSVNPYCKAYVEHYNSLDVAGWYHFFQQEHNYWCTEKVLKSIKKNWTLPCDTNSGLCDDDQKMHIRASS